MNNQNESFSTSDLGLVILIIAAVYFWLMLR